MYMDNDNKTHAHTGFSLIIVLVVALVGMALIGVAFYIYESSAGQTDTTLQRSLEYNALQEALEKGKNHLLTLVNRVDTVPRWSTADVPIKNPQALRIPGGYGGALSYSKKVGGENADIKIEIFDMLYDASKVSLTDPATSVDLPASMRLVWLVGGAEPSAAGAPSPTDYAGAYLIRATLTIGGQTKRMEVSVVQRNANI